MVENLDGGEDAFRTRKRRYLIGPSQLVEVSSPCCARGFFGRPLVNVKTMGGKDLVEDLKRAGLEKGG